MRIGLLSSWASRAGGGVFEALVAHVALLRNLGHEPIVFGLEDEFSAVDRFRFDGTSVNVFKVLGPAQLGFTPTLKSALLDAQLDILHLHGIWMFPSAAAASWQKATKKPYLISPHGMLDPWIISRGKAKKRIARVIYEQRSWTRATLFHALNIAEANAILRSVRGANVRVVPNAIGTATRSVGMQPGRTRFTYLGRLHVKKNVVGLLAAWRHASRLGLRAELRIAGWGDASQVRELSRLIAEMADERVTFLGPVYGHHKIDLLAKTDFVILPSFSEGLPMVILEAWAAGIPTVMSSNCNLSEGFDLGAAIDCGTSERTIAQAILLAASVSPRRHLLMSNAARELIYTRFSSRVVRELWRDTLASIVRYGHKHCQ